MDGKKEESEGQKDRHRDKSVWRRAGGGEVGRISSSSVVCSSGLAGKRRLDGLEGGFEGGGRAQRTLKHFTCMNSTGLSTIPERLLKKPLLTK